VKNTTRPVLVVDVVGLTPRLLAHMPNTRRVAADGFTASLETILPAVTCSVQSTLLTGLRPRDHGIVGNGWYFRDLGDVLLWRQHNALVGGDKVWDAARRAAPGYTVANVCWWYAMGAATDITVTPRPIYHADGRKSPDCYTRPPRLRDELTRELGTFPLFNYWGPTASIDSSRWIAAAARRVMAASDPDLTLVYVPHLDYDLQRYGPDGPEAVAAAREVDAVLGPLLDAARVRGATVVVLSEYGITAAHRPVDVNRELRRAGLLEVHTQAGMEYLDPWASRAFAVADHQVAHLYVRDPADLSRVRDLVAGLEGVDEVLDDAGKAAYGLDHARAGQLVAVAEPDAWFTYYYWLDDGRAPDFARTVEIHRKPGYDPAELFFDPADRTAKLRAAAALARKKLGLRYTMQVVPLDPAPVRGSHGRLPDDPRDGPVLLCSDATRAEEHATDTIAATEVKDLLLRLAGLTQPTAPTAIAD
jgi:predicted AlkP superfamily pyrophosphatase or phosphodiesterase